MLVREETLQRMKPGSVIVDLAAEQGGNCALTEPDRVIVAHGVVIVGHCNLPAMVGADASALYARNLLSFVTLLVNAETGDLTIDRTDDIVDASLVCLDGAAVRTPEAPK
jgi:NAD(P) transhydrogenase subunit alpha